MHHLHHRLSSDTGFSEWPCRVYNPPVSFSNKSTDFTAHNMDHLHRNNLYDVKDRVALVTGGGTGIGLMITEALVANGAKVYIGSRRGEKVQQTARETPGHIVPLELDVGDKDSIRNAVKTIEQNDGKLDLLVNNAGITGPSSPFFNDQSAAENKSPGALGTALFENEKIEDWNGLYGNNVAAIFFVTNAFLGLLAKASEQRGPWSAGVINISSVSGQIRISQAKWAYNSSKSANIQLTKMFATEFALRNIPPRGVFPSEMTGYQDDHTLGEKDVNKAAQGLHDVPFKRSGKTNLYDASGRVALVTGGGTGIGLMITKTLAANGAKVYIGSRRGEKVEATAKEESPKLDGQIIPIELDVTDKSSIKNAVKTISENDGKLDILVNNAGITGPVSSFLDDDSAPENKSAEAVGNALFENEKVEEWTGLYGNNVASIFFVTTAFLGLLSKASELRISQNKFAYNSAKTANIQLTKMLATEFALRDIQVRVNSIAPGVYPSEMTGVQGSHTLSGKEASEIGKGLRPIPFQRSGNDIDMGGLALFLSSPAGYYLHGQVITTDGGFTAVHPAVA
ncbi:unnamed protein product [Rhizoctonia solani]|uniref:Short-chain dehydrogenase n=1 Tax=Rhizoctonia solani TaxID=456999 RepID=A0A8H2X2U0_9AGAM|nr:unnamed protein product [Rhizoctonia solani]